MGYTGGTRRNPSYASLGDHTESIRIDFDPSIVSYEQLLEVFWASHDPTQRPWSAQYKAAVFYQNDRQKRLAMTTREREAARRQRPIFTEMLPASEFYLAEAYHQKYRLRQDRALMKEFNEMYPSDEDFANSTSAARVNGYLAGYGSIETFEQEEDGLGLSLAAKERLASNLKRHGRR